LIDDPQALPILRNADHLGMEIHCSFLGNNKGERHLAAGLPDLKVYSDWIADIFADSHLVTWSERIDPPVRAKVVLVKA
jgi:hypothetical protein